MNFLNDPVWYIASKRLIYLTSPIVKHDLTSNIFTFSNWKAFWDRKKNIVLCLQWLQSHRTASKVQLSRNKQWHEMRKPVGKGRMMKVWESEWRMVDDEMGLDGGWGGGGELQMSTWQRSIDYLWEAHALLLIWSVGKWIAVCEEMF